MHARARARFAEDSDDSFGESWSSLENGGYLLAQLRDSCGFVCLCVSWFHSLHFLVVFPMSVWRFQCVSSLHQRFE